MREYLLAHRNSCPVAPVYTLSLLRLIGAGRPVLKQTSWLGRHHALSRDDLSAYLDGELSRVASSAWSGICRAAPSAAELASLRETQALLPLRAAAALAL